MLLILSQSDLKTVSEILIIIFNFQEEKNLQIYFGTLSKLANTQPHVHTLLKVTNEEADHLVKGVKAFNGQRAVGNEQGSLQTQLGVTIKEMYSLSN